MDGSGNTLVSPISLLPSPISKFNPSSGGYDENEPCHNNVKTSLKSPSSTKHYMSPTISAASKAAVPRKKILAERNGVQDVEQILFPKPFNISPKVSSPRCSVNGHVRPKSCSFEPSIVDAITSVRRSTNGLSDVQSPPSFAEPANDLSLKPYDPVTNYLSPRPQFLRYNPNRRHMVFMHPENEVGEKGVGVDAKRGLSFDTQKPAFEEALGEDSQGSSVWSSEEDSDKEEDEKTGYENDDEHSSVFSSVEDDEGSSAFSSEEDPVKEECKNAEVHQVHEKVEEEEEDESEVFEDERGWNLRGACTFLFVLVSLMCSTHYIATMNSPSLTDNNQGGVWGFKSQHHENHLDMYSNFSEGAAEPICLWGKSEIGLTKFVQGDINDGFEEEFFIRDDQDNLVDITSELFEMEAESLEVHKEQALDSIDIASDDIQVFEMEKGEEFSNELQASEAVEIHEDENNSGLGFNDEQMGSSDENKLVDEVPSQLVEDEVDQVQDTNSEVDELDTGEVESGTKGQENDSMEFVFPKLDSIQTTAIVVPIIFTILASLGVVYYFRRKNVRTEEPHPEVEPLLEPVLAENVTLQTPIMEEEEEKSDGAETFATTSSLVSKAQKEAAVIADIRQQSISHSHSHQSHAPSVELLGEFVVGEVSSSRRSKNSEKYSNKSVSESEKGSFAEASEVLGHAKTSTSLGLSAADSTTFDQSSTSDRRKKRGKDAEETTPVRRSSRVLPSPVRRSSRLRDRSSAMSP